MSPDSGQLLTRPGVPVLARQSVHQERLPARASVHLPRLSTTRSARIRRRPPHAKRASTALPSSTPLARSRFSLALNAVVSERCAHRPHRRGHLPMPRQAPLPARSTTDRLPSPPTREVDPVKQLTRRDLKRLRQHDDRREPRRAPPALQFGDRRRVQSGPPRQLLLGPIALLAKSLEIGGKPL